MWAECPQILDEEAKIWGLELEDFALVGAAPLLANWWLSTVMSFALAGVLGIVLYLAKRGKPPGALLHWLHGLELTRLPGILRPTIQRYSPW